MNVHHMHRDANKVKAALTQTEDGRLVALKPVKIYVPTRFAERGLASIGVETQICGVYAMTVDDSFYAVSMVNAMVPITPTSMMKVMIDDDEYFEFEFEKGSTVIPLLDLLKTDSLVYKIYNEIIAGGHTPWYLSRDYALMALIFDTAKEHAGANIGQNHEVTELLISMVARNAKNRNEYYRHAIKSMGDLITNPPVMIPLRSVEFAASNTLNKLAGSYFSRGVVSALVNPTDRMERLDNILQA
jgi:hypothetical protein